MALLGPQLSARSPLIAFGQGAQPASRQLVDDGVLDALASSLRVLASDSRLQLLRTLRTPKTLDEILLAPSIARADARPDRAVSRQAVQRHLDVLMEAGLVKRQLTRRGVSRSGYEYLLDHTRVFALLEELRALTAYRSTMRAELVETQVARAHAGAAWAPGPKLVLVHGVREGHAFPLREEDGAAWRIGRAEDVEIALPYDPFVSQANAQIVRTASGFVLRDLSAKNGTTLNWQPLPAGGQAMLRAGDIIGVGRSLLVFRDE